MALRPVQAENAITEYFDELVKQRAPAEVGLLIGKPVVGSRSLLLAVVPSPEQDGQPAVTVSASAAAPSAKGKKAAGGGGGASVQLEGEWVAEHARQVARMLPGGLDVLGLYLFAPDAAWAPAAGALCGALATIASDARAAAGDAAAGDAGVGAAAPQLLVLHVDSGTRKMTARGCAAAPAPSPAGLRVAELRSGSAVGSLLRLTAHHAVDVALPAVASSLSSKQRGGGGGSSGGRQLQDWAEALVASEAARVGAALAALGGALPPDGAALADVLPPDAAAGGAEAVAEARLFCALPSTADGAGGGGGAEAAAAAQQAALSGSCLLRGEVVGVAYVHRREPAARALAELKADVIKSLRARLDLLVEEALASADEAGGGGASGASGGAAHPLLLPAGSGRAARLALPRRVLLPWRVAGAELRVCDYLAEGEGPEEAAARAQELLGLSEADAARVEQLEAAPAMGAARSGGGGGAAAKVKGTAVPAAAAAAAAGSQDAAACSGTMVAGLAAGAAAVLAVAVGYLGLGSS